MKKPFYLLFALLLVACSSESSTSETEPQKYAWFKESNGEWVSKAYEEPETRSLEEEIEFLKEKNASLNSELREKDSEIESLEAVSEAYHEFYKEMEPYRELADAEIEARKIEAESIVAESKKAEEESIAAEKAAAEAKEKLGYDTGITYEQLARNPEDYRGEKIKFTGTVLQVIESSSEIQLRLATSKGYDDVIYCKYSPDIVSSRILEDDRITVYGKSSGTVSYQSTLGGKITIPGMHVDKIDLKNK
ncbi:toxin regulator [Oribacterium sp. C9]|uniref:toxin regulator n=1 Tax=Oribacterium sp. C9 TaxID=1943579 RepID=UPI0019806D1E|nr:toxin regulator [Oribacterium sp. C9]